MKVPMGIKNSKKRCEKMATAYLTQRQCQQKPLIQSKKLQTKSLFQSGSSFWVIVMMVLLCKMSKTDSLCMEKQWKPHNSLPNQRRFFLSSSVSFWCTFLGGSSYASEPESTPEENSSRIYKLMSGVQFRDVRVGGGPPVAKSSETVLLHLRALTRDGAVLFDTRLDQNGSPLLHQFGSSQDFDYFGGDPSKRPKVTPGVEDAILSRGKATWNGSEGKQSVEPMRQGGIRKVVVPSALAYGHAGVSRYDAYRMGIRKAVPRDELISYEIELLRCTSVPIELMPPPSDANPTPDPISTTVEACCIEDNYPCPTPNQ